MTSTVTVRHNAEMGHRLPHLEGKCQSLHGHSWWFEVEVGGLLDPDTGIVVEFANLKASLRGWIDARLDHGLCLGSADPLVPLLKDHGKVEVIPGWPTVETLAWYVAQQIDAHLLAHYGADGGLGIVPHVVRCTAQETHVNAATWRPS